MIRAHQPGSEPIDIPETIPNPVVVPKPTPTPTEPAPKEPVRIPEKVPQSGVSTAPGCLRWQEWPRFSADAEMIRRRPIQQYIAHFALDFSRKESICGTHMRCSSQSTPEQKTELNRIIVPIDSDQLSTGVDFKDLKSYQRCPPTKSPLSGVCSD